MNNKTDFLNQLGKEIDEYKGNMLNNSKVEIYDKYYEIFAMEELYDYLSLENLIDYSIQPKENILNFYYHRFLRTDYNLTPEDMRDFIKDVDSELKQISKRNENEM